MQALGHYDNNQFEEALRVFDNIADTSKILFNCGVIHATLGEHDKAVGCLCQALAHQTDQTRLNATNERYASTSTLRLHTFSKECQTS